MPMIVENPAFQIFGGGNLWGIPIPGVLLVIALLLGGVVLGRDRYGRYVYAIGGGDEASRLTGLRTRSVRTLAYVITGALAALAGCVIASQLGEGQGDIGRNVELGVITIVIVGGNAVSGGEGAMWRTATGIGILAILGNSFDHLQVSTFWQEVIEGVIVIGALAIDSYGKRRGRGIASRLGRFSPERDKRGDIQGVHVLVLQHIACESPGVYEDVLRERGARFIASNLTSMSRFPTGRASTRLSPWAAR